MANQTAREAWVDLLGPDGDAIHSSPAILAWDGEKFVNDGPISFGPLGRPQDGPLVHIVSLRLTFADGEQRIVDL